MSALYPLGKEGMGDGTINLANGDIRVMLVHADYKFNTSHKYLSDLGYVDNGRSSRLENQTFINGVFDADDTKIIASEVVECGSLIYYQYSGNDESARVIAHIDSPSAGLPFKPSVGQVINIKHSNGPNRIFKL